MSEPEGSKELQEETGPGPSKRKKAFTSYSDQWERHPNFSKWIQKKDDYTAMCKFCQTDISIKYEGSRALDKHNQTIKHSKLISCQKISGNLQIFFVKKDTLEEQDISKAELLCVFHNVTHGLSYNSLDCQIKLALCIYTDSKIANKISCGRTKAAAIARNVLSPHAIEQVVQELKEAEYFSVASDASNIGNVKTYPYAVQYFSPQTGISKKLLDFYDDPFEASSDIFKKIKDITETNELKLSQISAYTADNASVNYGVNNSVFQKLKQTNNHLIKTNCKCHVINNCIKYALKALSVDIESIVIKTFNEFSSSSTKTEKLKECFLFASVEYKNLLRHVPTRWLSLMPALERLLHGWPAIKHYFLSKGEDECRKEIWDFVSKNLTSFDNNEGVDECYSEGISEVYLYFVPNVMIEFQTAILALENDECTVLEIDSIMRKLLNQLKSRLQDRFYGSKNRSILSKLPNADKELFIKKAEQFFKRAITYLEDRFDFSEESLYKTLSKFSLKKETLFTWNELLELVEKLNILNDINIDNLYTDYCSLKEVFSLNRFSEEKNKMSNDKLWAYFIRNCVEVKNLTKILCFIFSIGYFPRKILLVHPLDY